MPGWALRFAAFFATLLVLAGSSVFVAAYPKNGEAPLQPSVAAAAATGAPVTFGREPAFTPLPPLVPNRGGRPRPASSPEPLASFAPGVQHTALPSVSITHVS